MSDKENLDDFILENGDPDPSWIMLYMITSCCNENKARYDWGIKMRELEEPPLKTEGGKPNPIWITWWKVRTGCTRNIATNVCKSKIAGTYVPNKRTNAWLNQPKTTKLLESF